MGFKIFQGMLFGLDDLWESCEDILKDISYISKERICVCITGVEIAAHCQLTLVKIII